MAREKKRVPLLIELVSEEMFFQMAAATQLKFEFKAMISCLHYGAEKIHRDIINVVKLTKKLEIYR